MEKMSDYAKYNISVDDLEFLQELRAHVVDSQCPTALDCNGYGFLVEPLGTKLEVWRNGSLVCEYSSFEDFVQNFQIGGKPFIFCLNSLEYAE